MEIVFVDMITPKLWHPKDMTPAVKSADMTGKAWYFFAKCVRPTAEDMTPVVNMFGSKLWYTK